MQSEGEIEARIVGHGGLFNFGTRFAQYGFWGSHVDFRARDGQWIGARADGVRRKPDGYDRGTVKREMRILIGATPAQASAFHDFIEAQEGKPYDYKAIFAFVIERDWNDPGAWDCAELGAAGFMEAGLFSQQLAEGSEKNRLRRVTLLALYQLIKASCPIAAIYG